MISNDAGYGAVLWQRRPQELKESSYGSAMPPEGQPLTIATPVAWSDAATRFLKEKRRLSGLQLTATAASWADIVPKADTLANSHI